MDEGVTGSGGCERGCGGEGQGNRPNGRSERDAGNEAGSGNDQER